MVTLNLLREIIIFLLIGGTSAVLYTLLGAGFTLLGAHPGLAILLTLVVLMPPTYWAQRQLTFRSDRRHRAAFPRYVGTQCIGNGIGLLGAALWPSEIARQPLIGFAVIAVVVAMTNYLCLKFWAFRETVNGRDTERAI